MSTHSPYRLSLCCITLLCAMACQDPEPQDFTTTDMSADASTTPDHGRDSAPDLDMTPITQDDMDQPDQREDRDMPLQKTDMSADMLPDLGEPGTRTYLYVGGGNFQGGPGFITRHVLDDTSGQFEDRQDVLSRGQGLNYMVIDPQRGLLHAVDEPSNDVYSVSLDTQTGLATGAATTASARCHGVHITLDDPGEHAIVSCYREGKTALLALDASTSELSWQDSADSGAKSHQAMLSPDGRHVFVVSLEEQHVVRYTIESGKLTDPTYTSIPGRIGPRHMAFHPTAPRAYVLGEKKPTLITARYTDQGNLEELDSTGLDEGRESFDTAGAAIRVHPSGRWVLSTQRFLDERDGRIVITELDAQGVPTGLITHSSSMGKSPRDLVISADGELVAVSNRRSESVAVFRFDAETGALAFVQELAQPNMAFVVYFWKTEER